MSSNAEETATPEAENAATPTSAAGATPTRNSAGSETTRDDQALVRADRRNVHIDTTNKDFIGEEPTIGAVLATKSERVDMKASFDAFREKISNYIVRTITNGADCVTVVRDMVDPKISFVATKKPKTMTVE